MKYRSTGSPFQDQRRWDVEKPGRPTYSEAAGYCRSLAIRHEENFSVVSWFLPRKLREHFTNIYAYCRWADDLADEEGRSFAALDRWNAQLDQTYAGHTPDHPVFVALERTIQEFSIPKTPFVDLLSAFRQDQQTLRYETRAQLLDYCRRSANPVGRLVLYLARVQDDVFVRQSDAICTGLQLANFWQDVARDNLERGRIYLPQEDLRRFGVSEEILIRGTATAAFLDLIREETEWTRTFFEAGARLAEQVPKPFRKQIRLFQAGGLAVLDAIQRQGYDVLRQRPRWTTWQKCRIFLWECLRP